MPTLLRKRQLGPGFDICHTWQVNQYHFPLIYHVTLDILPVQASAVLCERVFSSSKEMDTL
ncbi:uncharacterized protein PHACADRAFT_192197 [Phanerochaete carnosa HHB-10118-sp]|uniref:HAT C-terminal dimerisation domain-containing protein n=1 Tax=Phanerochaete carnosa (strain HHB-10118-sp) TaxID=650164 RepID=K5W7C4_PHACS|nr:uncharacterized protein PHACADRAFT_192197 [Phanerochaete carnosa HHB-10118-sp]EKM59823.1 hypothetical protein PHACADRAFT_192197 [Phanerochaete carnosa HHB-10118-sp]